jgi:hypothetical protein
LQCLKVEVAIFDSFIYVTVHRKTAVHRNIENSQFIRNCDACAGDLNIRWKIGFLSLALVPKNPMDDLSERRPFVQNQS